MMDNSTTFQGNGEVAYIPVVVNGKQARQTNGDSIRSMSDEELADLIANACDYICKGTSCPLIRQNGITCEERILEWLRQECE